MKPTLLSRLVGFGLYLFLFAWLAVILCLMAVAWLLGSGR